MHHKLVVQTKRRTYSGKSWRGGNGYGQLRERGGQSVILQYAQMFDVAFCNTFYNKKDEHLITYRSGNKASVID